MVKDHYSSMYLISAIIITVVCDVVYADPLFVNCLNGPNYPHRSPFEQNLKLLLQSLPSNTSVHKGYYDFYVGNNASRVYGQALCRGDAEPGVCEDCLDQAGRKILEKCNRKEAIIWYEYCQIRYSSTDFSTSTAQPYFKYPESYKQKRLVTIKGFDDALNRLIWNLTSNASDNQMKFAVGEISLGHGVKIYGLAQCVRSIALSDCKNCLTSGLGDLHVYSDRVGGAVVSAKCNLRYELNKFYNGLSIVVAYPPPTGMKHLKLVYILICISSMLFHTKCE